MKRFHALEWEDLKWFPTAWRDYGTDYLRFIATRFDIYKPVIPILKKGLGSSTTSEWVDVASGGGSGLISLSNHLKKDYPDLKITLTDFYPNIAAFERTKKIGGDLFNYESKPVDAKNVPASLHGKLRTMFGSFHHFRPNDAKTILQNAVDSNSPIAIFEPVGRNFMSFFSMIFVPLNVLILTPFIRPVRWQVLPFIYLIPLIPLYILWDGIASIFRTYSQKELDSLILEIRNKDNFDWETGSKKGGPSSISYLIGTPKKTNAHD